MDSTAQHNSSRNEAEAFENDDSKKERERDLTRIGRKAQSVNLSSKAEARQHQHILLCEKRKNIQFPSFFSFLCVCVATERRVEQLNYGGQHRTSSYTVG